MKKIGDLVGRVAQMQEKSKLQTDRKPQSETTLPSNVVKLPLWPDAVRGVPNTILRSALFGVVMKGARRYMEGEKIAAVDGVGIYYTGQRLDQGDLDSLGNVFHFAREQEMGQECRFTAYQMLKALGKTDTGGNRTVLHKRLMRLNATSVEIKHGRFSYAGSLIDGVYRDDETHEYIVILNPKLRPLFDTSQFTQLDWDVRQALIGKSLAQWLHGFYAGHAKPYPYKVETLNKLCGSETKELFHYRSELRNALKQLAAQTGWSWKIDKTDLVYIDKTPTPSQNRHLMRRKTDKKPRIPS